MKAKGKKGAGGVGKNVDRDDVECVMTFGMKGKKWSRYVLKRDIVIPAGTVFHGGPDKVEYRVPHGEALIGLGKNHCAAFIASQDLMESNPDMFTRENE